MPVHSIAQYLDDVPGSVLLGAAASVAGLVAFKRWAAGRGCTWEREWAGKMVLIAAPPTANTLALVHHLLHLPSPPQILYLAPIPSPLPQELLTLLHTLRISATRSSPLAQLHCEALPPTPRAVREFVNKWANVPQGIAGDGGRRIDAIVLGGGWELEESISPSPSALQRAQQETLVDPAQDPEWTPEEFHFHMLTSLLPLLLKFPTERNVRIVRLVAPTYTAAIPAFAAAAPGTSAIQRSGAKALRALLFLAHFQRILDTLLAATLASTKPIPSADGAAKKRDTSLQSNIMAISVVMPWDRNDMIQPLLGATQRTRAFSWSNYFFYLLLWPVIFVCTPGPSQAIQSILFALSAPVRYGPVQESVPKPLQPGGKQPSTATANGPRDAVAGGDVVRDCAVIDVPPFIHDPILGREQYERLEKQVEAGVKASLQREKAYPLQPTTLPEDDREPEPEVEL